MVKTFSFLITFFIIHFFSLDAYCQETDTTGQSGSIVVCGSDFLFRPDKALANLSNFENEFQNSFFKGLARQARSTKIDTINNLKNLDLTRSYIDVADPGFFFNLPTDLGYSRFSQSTSKVLMFERGMIILKNADSLHFYAMLSGNYVRIDAKSRKVIHAGTISIKVKGQKDSLATVSEDLVNRLLVEIFPTREPQTISQVTMQSQDNSGLKLGVILGHASIFNWDFEEPETKKTEYGTISKEKLTLKDRFNNSNNFYAGIEVKLNRNIGLSYIFSKGTMESNKSVFLASIGSSSFASEDEKLETTTNSFNLTVRQTFGKTEKWNYLFRGGVLFRQYSGTGKIAGKSFSFGAKNTADFECGFGIEFRPVSPLWGFQIYGQFTMGTVTINSMKVDGVKMTIPEVEYINKQGGIKIGVFYDILALRYQ